MFISLALEGWSEKSRTSNSFPKVCGLKMKDLCPALKLGPFDSVMEWSKIFAVSL